MVVAKRIIKRGSGWALAGLLALLLGGCASSGLKPQEFLRARFLLEAGRGGDYSAAVTLPVSRVQIPVDGDAILSEFDYQAIEVAEAELGKCLQFVLKPAATRAFHQVSVGNQGKRLVLLLNGQPMGARRIDGPIANGQIFIFLEVDDAQLEDIGNKLKETNREIQKKLTR